MVDLLEQGGAEIVGKTNCDEFGMGYVPHIANYKPLIKEVSSLNTHSIHGPVVINGRSAGGSSGGSAAAVATGMCDA